MDYKKIFASRKSRERILKFLRFIPDAQMIKVQYRIKTGRKLNITNPQRFTEKLQWYKLNYHNEDMHQCVDKYMVRNYIKEKGLEENLVPLYGHYTNISQIDFEKLPDQFVIKSTNGAGGLDVVVVKDKKNFLKTIDNFEFETKPFLPNSGGREWPYYGLDAGIVVEKLLINKDNPEAGVNDYKFFCFNGRVECIVVDVDRYVDHKRNFYDSKWNDLHITSDCKAIEAIVPEPGNLSEMMRVAETLSSDFPFVRVDLYNVDDKVYFGELTFYPWSGYVNFTPDIFDYELGDKFTIPMNLSV